MFDALVSTREAEHELLTALQRGMGRAMIEAMAQIHISEAELARNVASALDRVRSGTEIVIERNAQPVAVLRLLNRSDGSFQRSRPRSPDNPQRPSTRSSQRTCRTSSIATASRSTHRTGTNRRWESFWTHPS